jgi:type IV pilus assembly protein PilE
MRLRDARGFTIIEVMIVVAIISILAAIAIPNYTDYVRRGKLQEGASALLAMRVKMEQFFQDNRSYNPAALAAPACPIPVQTLKYFTIACPNLPTSGTQYTLEATGTGDLAGVKYTLTEANLRGSTVTSGSVLYVAGYRDGVSNCWTTRKGGTC